MSVPSYFNNNISCRPVLDLWPWFRIEYCFPCLEQACLGTPLPYKKIGRAVRFDPMAIDAWIEAGDPASPGFYNK